MRTPRMPPHSARAAWSSKTVSAPCANAGQRATCRCSSASRRVLRRAPRRSRLAPSELDQARRQRAGQHLARRCLGRTNAGGAAAFAGAAQDEVTRLFEQVASTMKDVLRQPYAARLHVEQEERGIATPDVAELGIAAQGR